MRLTAKERKAVVGLCKEWEKLMAEAEEIMEQYKTDVNDFGQERASEFYAVATKENKEKVTKVMADLKAFGNPVKLIEKHGTLLVHTLFLDHKNKRYTVAKNSRLNWWNKSKYEKKMNDYSNNENYERIEMVCDTEDFFTFRKFGKEILDLIIDNYTEVGSFTEIKEETTKKVNSLCMELRRKQDELADLNNSAISDTIIERLTEIEAEIKELSPDKTVLEAYKESGFYRKKYLIVDHLTKEFAVIFEPLLSVTPEEDKKFKQVLENFKNNPYENVVEYADFEAITVEQELLARGFKETMTFKYDDKCVKEIFEDYKGREFLMKYEGEEVMSITADEPILIKVQYEKMKDIRVSFTKDLIIVCWGKVQIEIPKKINL